MFVERKEMDCAFLEQSKKNGEKSHLSPPANARHSHDKKRKLEKVEKTCAERRKWYTHIHRGVKRRRRYMYSHTKGFETENAFACKILKRATTQNSGDRCSQFDT